MGNRDRFSRKAFTLIELLIYLGIFSLVIVGFITIFVGIVRIQGGQSASAEVETQSQFLLQKIQYYVEQASLIDMPTDVATTTLTLRMANPSQDPTYIILSGGILYIQQSATGTLQALSSNQVTITNLSFTKRSNAPSHDSVSVAMTVAYNTPNIQQAFSQVLQTSIARVSAATFDSNLVPSTTALWNVGVSGNIWNSINQIINFSGSNVGIGVSSPQSALDVSGGESLGSYAGSAAAPTNGFIVSGKVGIGTSSPAFMLDVKSNGSTTARFGTVASDTIVVGGGAGKITAGNFDPAYVIDGQGFATFLPGMTGLKEETAGTIVLSQAGNGTYQAVLDFGSAAVGSDLWLFRKVIDPSDNFNYLSLLLTPSFNGNVWYEKDASHNRIIIHGSAAGEVSYQLTGRRFDWSQWPNNTGIPEGVAVPNGQ